MKVYDNDDTAHCLDKMVETIRSLLNTTQHKSDHFTV